MTTTLDAEPSLRTPTTTRSVFATWPGKRSSCSVSSVVVPPISGGGGATSETGEGRTIGIAPAGVATTSVHKATAATRGAHMWI